jgi:molybdopterin adenylyltransferase
MSAPEHRKDAPTSVRCAVLTISDTRHEGNDTSGDAIVALLTTGGHAVAARRIVRDDPDLVRDAVHALGGSADVVITTGGTGISGRDNTYDAIQSLLTKRIDGFGELFRALSYQEIGAAAMLSRAVAGAVGTTAVFTLPGSEHAVRLAMTKLILPELGHVVRELKRQH